MVPLFHISICTVLYHIDGSVVSYFYLHSIILMVPLFHISICTVLYHVDGSFFHISICTVLYHVDGSFFHISICTVLYHIDGSVVSYCYLQREKIAFCYFSLKYQFLSQNKFLIIKPNKSLDFKNKKNRWGWGGNTRTIY